mmetsp:Transcript_46895/g.77594  ORF Transcript_46895/g.77594 Transcript_46895/m.77594 type:complete len:495 (-) Transcript_46895:340-1824(-)
MNVDRSCTWLRKQGDNRVLFVGGRNPFESHIVTTGLIRAGWAVYVLQPWDYDAKWSSQVKHVLKVPALNASNLVAAVESTRPSLVLPDYVANTKLMQQAVRSVSVWTSASHRKAINIVRCSLPDEKYYEYTVSKSKFISLAGGLGVLTPPSIQIPPSIGRRKFSTIIGSLLQKYNWQPPIILKSNVDGTGAGVWIVRDWSAMSSLDSDSRSKQLLFGGTIQKMLQGATSSYVITAVDGVVVADFSLVKTATYGQTGASLAIQTITDLTTQSSLRRVLQHIRYTGVAAADLITTTTGASYLIDFNPRMSNFATTDGKVLHGSSLHSWYTQRGLLDSLRLAISGKDIKPVAARSSVSIVKFKPDDWQVRLPPSLLCPGSVYVAVPWEDPAQLNRYAYIRFNRSSCTFWHTARPNQVAYQSCDSHSAHLCNGKCVKLRREPQLPANEVSAQVCHAEGSGANKWLKQRLQCLHPFLLAEELQLRQYHFFRHEYFCGQS